ncbi:hypothetical protein HMPREF1487_04323 [Pseudomonas sp. HPB0071]|uniref:Uncharacterized protein n=1 Tax=Pseudomonas luteola TaxID=47886 RepID=A0A2X2CPA4_PSELU|nr:MULTISPECIES: hypothetical protein [Pseudomonas]ENA37405.1 hypothetical protein HMPREF1487_04323 [Pseudomonas sp. HPB0071]MBF8642248.1 hypothetical protein [Pseudomonas zeshuii]RRW48365.1 hypothetical protein EGJ50_10435 [Pseudomonas luteola]SHJ24913.1 hypothetical protein SAMN05216295_109248 [Pseudomonas zeshuii]SPZ07466.1 Uncharacterised protein [Pseudomonas luteola]
MDEIHQLKRNNILLQLQYLEQQRHLNALQTEKLEGMLKGLDEEKASQEASDAAESIGNFA